MDQLPAQQSRNQAIEGELFQGARLEEFLPKGQDPMRFRITVSEILASNNRLLQAARNDPGSFLAAIHNAADLGLSLNPQLQEAHLVTKWDKTRKGDVVALRPGYKGLKKLVCQDPDVADIWADVIYQGDLYKILRGTDPKLLHEPNYETPRTDDLLRFAYAVVKFRDGRTHFEVMTKAEVDKCMEASDTFKKDENRIGPWWKHRPEMWKKTAIRRLTKNRTSENEKLTKAEALDNDDYDWNGSAPLVKTTRQLQPTKPAATAPSTPADMRGGSPQQPPPAPLTESLQTEPEGSSVSNTEAGLNAFRPEIAPPALYPERGPNLPPIRAPEKWIPPDQETQEEYMERCRQAGTEHEKKKAEKKAKKPPVSDRELMTRMAGMIQRLVGETPEEASKPNSRSGACLFGHSSFVNTETGEEVPGAFTFRDKIFHNIDPATGTCRRLRVTYGRLKEEYMAKFPDDVKEDE